MNKKANNKKIKLDIVDEKILKLMNDDARTPYRKIARELNISVGTVHNRIEKLTKNGVVEKFAPVLDHNALGYKVTTIIGVKIKGGSIEDWEGKTSFNKNVLGIYDVTGEYDAFLIAKFKDTDELNHFIKELLKEPGIERTYTQTVLNTVKSDMNSASIL
ncbi:MAG: Lrp/AsnC family transcriptional regulator [Methanobacteriaceae archaeon]